MPAWPSVPARDGNDPPLAEVQDQPAVLDRRRGGRKLQLGEASEPQHRPRQPAGFEHHFRHALLPRVRAGRIPEHGADDRREHHVADPGPHRGVDGGAMLADPATDGIGADQEHPAAAGKGVAQRSRVVEVAVADVGTASPQLAQRLRTASDEDEVLGRNALQQLFCDEAAEVAGRSCDDEAQSNISGD
jgi:hypothetical protein